MGSLQQYAGRIVELLYSELAGWGQAAVRGYTKVRDKASCGKLVVN